MSKEMNELRKMNKEQLLERRKDMKILLMGGHRGVHPLIQSGQIKNVKRSIARIDFLLGELRRDALSKREAQRK